MDLRWHTASEFAALSRDEKTELSNWQRTDDGKKATSDARNQHFKAKKRKNPKVGKKDEKKLRARVAVLEKEKATKEKEAGDTARVSQIAAALSRGPTQGSRAAGADNHGLAREIMGIMARDTSSEGKSK